MTPQECPDARLALMRWAESDLVMSTLRPATGSWLVRVLRQAPLWWVSADMTELITGASESLPAEVRLDHELIPSPYGVAFFEETAQGMSAMRIHDELAQVLRDFPGGASWGQRVAAHLPEPGQSPFDAVVWGPLTDDDLETELVIGFLWQVPLELFRSGDVPTRWMYIGDTIWRFGRHVTDDHREVTVPGFFHPDRSLMDENRQRQLAAAAEDRRRIAALWLVSTQDDLTEPPEPAAINRAIRKRSQREGVTSGVRVIYPSRRASRSPRSGTGAGSRVYKHRWIVGHFWRSQAYGPRWTLRRWRLILSHERGPEGAPLLDPDKAVRKVIPPDSGVGPVPTGPTLPYQGRRVQPTDVG